jgi:hypothetical protein
MSAIETEFKVLKDDQGRIIGFSLIAQPQREAEVFCGTFPQALVQKKADIVFQETEIVFEHPTCRFSGRCAHHVESEDLKALNAILNGDRKLHIERAGFLTPGFQIHL